MSNVISFLILSVIMFSFASSSVYGASLDACSLFTRNTLIVPLVVHPDVANLQKLLNQDPDTRLATNGPGALGQETTTYGARTFLAVKRFQEKYRSEILTPLGLNQATGRFGINTRNKLSSLYCIGKTTASAQATQRTQVSPEVQNAPTITTTVQQGSQPAEGSISLTPASCVILMGARTCLVEVSWETRNARSPLLSQGSTAFSVLPNSREFRGISFGETPFVLSDIKFTKIATAVCVDGGEWNGYSCAASVTTSAASLVKSVPIPLPNPEQQVSFKDENVISIKKGTAPNSIIATPALYKKDGSIVVKLEDIPEGITTTTWMSSLTHVNPLTVIFEPGTYQLVSSWNWTAESSGFKGAPIIVKARIPGSVVISGGQTFQTDLILSQKSLIKKTANTLAVIPEQLWVNGARAVRARTPDAGTFYYVGKKALEFNGQTTINQLPTEKQVFISEKKVTDVLSSLSSTDLKNAILVAVQSWTTGYHHIVTWNQNNEIQVTPPTLWPFNFFGSAQRFFIDNIQQGLDAEGEWYVDGNKTLSYISRASDVGTAAQITAPQLEKILTINGNTSKKISNIVFDGLQFSYSGYNIPVQGMTDNQGAADVTGAITVQYADTITFSHCEVSHTGGFGFVIDTKATHVTIDSCEIFDTGAGGVKIGNKNFDPTSDAVGYNILHHNRIHSTGHQFPGAPAVLIMKASNNIVEDNTINDTTYSGISIGWQWNSLLPSTAHDNHILRNFIYDIGQDSMSDMGGIYTLGNSPGTELRGNVIKNVHSFLPDGGTSPGLFNDQGSSNIVSEGNIVIDADAGGYFANTDAVGLVVSNNVFKGKSTEPRFTGIEINTANLVSTVPKAVRFENNYIYPTKDSFIRLNPSQDMNAIDFIGNHVSVENGISVVPVSCGKGCVLDGTLTLSEKTLTETPDVTKNSSAIFAKGALASYINDIPYTRVLSPSLLWKQNVADISSPQLGFYSSATNLSIGSPMSYFSTYPIGSSAISVQSIGGEKCFAFQDSATMLHTYEPFAQAPVVFESGMATENFTIRIDENSNVIHELRSEAGGTPGYTTGPLVVFDAKKGISAYDGTSLVSVGLLPLNEKVAVTIVVTFNTLPTYSITITYKDGTKVTKSNLAPKSQGWKRIGGIFFISAGTTTSTSCVNDILMKKS